METRAQDRDMALKALERQMKLLWQEGYNFDAICYRLRGGVLAALNMGATHAEIENIMVSTLEEMEAHIGRSGH